MSKITKAAKAISADATQTVLSWEGDSYDVLRSWPAGVRGDFGRALRRMQQGLPATLDVRPMPSIAKGVFELKTDDERAWYRLVYLAKIEDVIYVLDCFEKDTRKTERKDINNAVARFKNVQQRLIEERRNEKRKG